MYVFICKQILHAIRAHSLTHAIMQHELTRARNTRLFGEKYYSLVLLADVYVHVHVCIQDSTLWVTFGSLVTLGE